MIRALLSSAALAALMLLPTTVTAQTSRVVVEGGGGHAAFIDSPPIHHVSAGGGARVYVTPRVAVGAEFTWMKGPGIDRDRLGTGNVTFDFRAATAQASPKVVPYVVGGAGVMATTVAVGTGPYSIVQFGWTAGAGVRIAPHRRWYVAPEFRLGTEFHWRTGVVVGFRP